MELWIRSQDKTRLTKVNDLYLVHDDNNFCDYIGNNMIGHLAKYTQQGRALEVLDEIQKILKPQLIIKDSGKIIGSFEDTIIREGATYELKELSIYVYEMPQE